MALVGVVAALDLRHPDANLYTQVGLVLMIALASENAILVVEYARHLQADGHTPEAAAIEAAAIEAARRRFQPIIMTSFAVILGVLPRALRMESEGHGWPCFAPEG
jgi:hydrophobic/amphiphilic exporter-1 (mainly G- bacteria), HAE1 family